MHSRVFILLAWTVLTLRLGAEEWFIAPDGDDHNPGTLSRPFATLNRAQTVVRESQPLHRPAVLYLRQGTYHLKEPWRWSAADSGTEKHPVTLRPYRQEEVHVSGAQPLTATWSVFRGSVLSAVIPRELVPAQGLDRVYVNGRAMRMARYPNWDPKAKFLGGTAADAISADRAQKWAHPEGAFVHALHRHEWGDFHYRVLGRNADGTLALEGGWQNNRQLGMHEKHRFIENVFEELDAPGEWYFDATNRTLYLQPPEGCDLAKSIVEIGGIESLVELDGTSGNPVRFVKMEGLIFEQTARTFMKNREPLLRSDWTTFRGGAVHLKGVEDVQVLNCQFRELGGNALYLDGYNRRVRAYGCLFEDIGASAVCTIGETNAVRSPLFEYGQTQPTEKIDLTPGPRSAEYPADCTIEESVIRRCGQIEKQSAGLQVAMSSRITLRHCTLYDLPRAAVNIGDGCWGGHHIEYNDLFLTVQETGDHGSFNSWGRDRYWLTNIRAVDKQLKAFPTLTPFLDTVEPIYLENNRWRCDHGWDIDLDDGSSHYIIRNNVCLNGGLKLREGYGRVVENNILLNNTFHPHVWFADSQDVFRHNIVMKPYAPIGMSKVWGKEIDYNWFSDSKALASAQALGLDAHSVVAPLPFADPAAGDYRILKKHQIPAATGFQSFDPRSFGVTLPRLRAIVSRPVLPTLSTGVTASSSSMPKKTQESLQWMGATLKGIEGMGERSAAGLAEESGVAVVALSEEAPAAKMGLHAGDVILGAGGKVFKSAQGFVDWVKKQPKSSTVEVDVVRNQQPLKMKLSLPNP